MTGVQTCAFRSPKTVGTVTFTIQTKDREHVNTFVKMLVSQPKNYAKVTSQGGGVTGTGSTNQNYTVKAEVFSRTAEQYIRKLNVTMPKAKPKSADPDDESGSPVGAPGISAPFGGGELP